MPRPQPQSRPRPFVNQCALFYASEGLLGVKGNNPMEYLYYAYPEDPGPPNAYHRPQAMCRVAWRKMKDMVLEEWIQNAPGTRPQYFWLFSAPEPRRRLGGIGTPLSEAYPEEAATTIYGVPRRWCGREDILGQQIDPSDPPKYESQASYLKRLDLLLPGELERLTPEDFEPDHMQEDREESEEQSC